MNLVIVESPAKCQKLNQFLGKDYHVVASMGHFRDLPSKNIGVNLLSMEADYVISKEDVVKKLLKDAEKAKVIYLCTDPDREGEAISWHLKCVLPDDKEYRRATFQEITKKAVLKAVENYGEINYNLADAQQARRILDRIVGYKLSPELWKVFSNKRGLSAGRVQSVATRLIVEREREIREFIEAVSYKVFSFHIKDKVTFKAELKFQKEGSKRKSIKIEEESRAKELQLFFKDKDFVVESVIHKEQQKKPQPPFTTPNMQAKAANVLKMSAAKSMQIAQKLYEGGHITYHRTDSVAISDEALRTLRDYILLNYGEAYLPTKNHSFSSKSGSQEAHECIRPTKVELEQPVGLGGDELKLYQLIRNQYISCQMASGKDAFTSIILNAEEYLFEAKGRVEIFDGFRKLNRTDVQEKSSKKKEKDDEEKQKLPELFQGEVLQASKIESKMVKTKPPGRYSEASLIKKLEKEGIGRPSTYTSIVGTIVNRGYVRLKSRKYYAMDLGEQVTDFLVGRFPSVLDIHFTRRCEDRLDAIGEGEMDYQEFLIKFWNYLRKQLNSSPNFEYIPKSEGAIAQQKNKSTRAVKTKGKNTIEVLCPSCKEKLNYEESHKWPGRYFYVCRPCSHYLECSDKGRKKRGVDWLKPK